ncbi:hypothetical protein JYG34_03770 [Pseudomonas entomophila]|uniref:hypothetical protein n=1 Tax=Pseudomonas entomophila TaxID=312306 RepID=UPI001BCDF629|nr:hypothetical protein [Pseudomonas entomophila]QVM92157.1 hypothetical protein JYG34_03770 [Pseudomonas entomophila]
MVTHYSTNGLDSACGRSSETLVSTAVAEDVSCKTCQRSLAKPEAAASKNKTPSLAELRKTAKAAAQPAEVVAKPATKVTGAPAAKPAKAVEKAARSGGFSVKAAWAARLAEQSDRCRLPRGKAKQSHV